MTAARLERVRARMAEVDVEALLLSLGADLPWLMRYEAMPLERLTMLVVPLDDTPTLVVPRLEAPRVGLDDSQFQMRPWDETEDPIAIVASLVGARRRLALSDRTWARFVLALQAVVPSATWRPASVVTAALRAVKDDAEIAALRAAAAAADLVADALVSGEIPLIGRTEAAVSREIGARLVAEGHRRVNFAIVGSGPNSASPHHDAGQRVIGAGESVVCDFGGTMDGYCSDITRTVCTGEPTAELRHLYSVLEEAQAKAVAAATVGTTFEELDAVARSLIAQAGFGDAFIHRTGHGIGREEHEEPYVVAGNHDPLGPGHAFSIEPGIYLAGRFGARIEDIVVVTDAGPESLNHVDRALAVVDV